MILPTEYNETLERVRQGQLPRDFRIVRILLRMGLIEVENKYVAASQFGDQDGQPLYDTEHWVVLYRETDAARLVLAQDTEHQENGSEADDDTQDETETKQEEPLDARIAEVIETISVLFDDFEYDNVHITDILTSTPRMSIEETEDVIFALEKADILRFDQHANVCYLEEFPTRLQQTMVRSTLVRSQYTDASAAQETDELFVVLDLSANDALSERFVRKLFPYESGDALILCDLRHALAVLRLARIMLTHKQRQALRETVAIVGYSLKVREELAAFLVQAQEQGCCIERHNSLSLSLNEVYL